MTTAAVPPPPPPDTRHQLSRSEWASNEAWPKYALCRGDERFTRRSVPEAVIAELISICQRCPVQLRCLLWAEAQPQPVGFVVAGGERWKAWNYCGICGKKVRGVDRCPAHADVGEPIGTIGSDGLGRNFSVLDDH